MSAASSPRMKMFLTPRLINGFRPRKFIHPSLSFYICLASASQPVAPSLYLSLILSLSLSLSLSIYLFIFIYLSIQYPVISAHLFTQHSFFHHLRLTYVHIYISSSFRLYWKKNRRQKTTELRYLSIYLSQCSMYIRTWC